QLLHRLVDNVEREAQAFEDLDHAPARAPGAAAVQARGVEHVLPGAQLLEEGCLDRNPVYVAADLQRLGHHVPAEHQRCAGVRGQQRAENPDQRRFAAAVGTEDARDAACPDGQVELMQGHLVLVLAPPPWRARFALATLERLPDALNFDRRGASGCLLKTGMDKRKVPWRCPTTARS